VLNRQKLQWGVVEKFGYSRSISFTLLLHRSCDSLKMHKAFII
jgi:hypothetical protein